MEDINLNKSAVVFGGTSGIGLETAARLAAEGFVVIATGRAADRLRTAQARHPAVRFIAADSAQDGSLEPGLRDIGEISHAVIALGGSRGGGPLSGLTTADLEEGFQQKFFAHFRSLKAVLPKMAQDGSITFISGLAAQMAAPGTVGLAAINGAIEAMIRPLAAELAPIRVNGVSPGVVDTPWWNFLPAEQRRGAMDQYARASLVGRVAKPADIAEAVLFLVRNTFCTGHVITCDGGMRLAAKGGGIE